MGDQSGKKPRASITKSSVFLFFLVVLLHRIMTPGGFYAYFTLNGGLMLCTILCRGGAHRAVKTL